MMKKVWDPVRNVFLRPQTNTTDDIETDDIKRIAIDQTGTLESFYNLYEDQILGKMGITFKPKLYMLAKPIICHIYHGRTADSQNLLRMVGIDRPLRLSIILKMIQPSGIASIINYPRATSKYTRFLYFRFDSHIEWCDHKLMKRKNCHKIPSLELSATHIIRMVTYGIHVLVVLQLPPDHEAELDRLLEYVRGKLDDTRHNLELSPAEYHRIDQIIPTAICTNTPDLTKLNKLTDIYQRILQMKLKPNQHRPLEYTLTSIHPPHQHQDQNAMNNTVADEADIENFENTVLQQLSEMRVLQIRIDHELPDLLQGELEDRLLSMKKSFTGIKELYESSLGAVRDLLIRVRKQQNGIESINQELNSDVQKTIGAAFQKLVISLNMLESKGNLIKQLRNDGFEYCNVVKLGIDEHCSEQLVKDMLFKNDPEKFIFYCSDTLKEQSQKRYEKFYQRMKDQQKNLQVSVVYADFTYSNWDLKDMMIQSSTDQQLQQTELNSKLSSKSTKRKAPPPPVKASRIDEYINILLLGESGVGKSTLINAFANYLHFPSLQQAQNGQLRVIIPVSFLMTVNDNFDEQRIDFGEIDPNEDHTQSGQSVTQQCRSYVFDIDKGKKLRIIDTPGFGDTRGIDQDNINMDIIFSFLNNFSYLNGVCLLLKPNVSQLHPSLLPCLTQLFDYFGESIRDHVMFCFTNARSTFFAPGDTRPLLKKFFDTFPVKMIPFEKRNTFCFDSESFRYLIALQRDIHFDDADKEEYEKSWLQSVTESKRFRDYLCQEQHPYRKGFEWQSLREAQFEVKTMIRPMLEGMRNLLRNVLLYETNGSIQLKATPVDCLTIICYQCNRNARKLGPFWILPNHLHNSSHTCATNSRDFVQYRLEFEFINNETNDSKESLYRQRTRLCQICARFARFLGASRNEEDPFRLGLIRMVEEEKAICQTRRAADLNCQLVEELEKLRHEYEQVFRAMQSDENLGSIYDLIKSLDEISLIKVQIDSIKLYQNRFIESNERGIENMVTRL